MQLEQIRKVIFGAIKKEFGLESDFEVEYAESRFGDFTTNAPFRLAKALKQAPLEIAIQLAGAITADGIDSADAAGSGHVNIRMTDEYWLDRLKLTGSAEKVGNGKKVQVEFISANPTGPLTMANARGGYPGDVLGNVLKASGYEVTKAYYINDWGGQIEKLVGSLKAAKGLAEHSPDHYQGSYIKELADRLELKEQSDDQIAIKAVESLLADIRQSTKKMGIEFDDWVSERQLVLKGASKDAIQRLQNKGLVYEKDGAIWLESTKYGDDRDRVLQKQDGSITYLVTDIAQHIEFFEKQGFYRVIKVWGADHAGQVSSLREAVKQVAADSKMDFILVQLVRLIRDGKEVKMSKRAGSFVTMDELIDEVGSDVARFFFLMRSADSQMDFDLDLAKEQSQKNPYWYVMYSFARAGSILREAASRDLKPAITVKSITSLERQIIKQMSRLPELINEIALDYGVQRLSYFGIELARLFHDYYESERIIKLPRPAAEGKLALVQKYKDVLKEYFELMGIAPLEKM